MRIRNQGFSLIEVMMSAAILAIVVLGIADSTRLAARGNASDSMSNDFAILEQNLFNVFSTPACDAALGGQALNVATVSTASPQSISSIAAGGQVFATTVSPLAQGLIVSTLQIDSAQQLPALGPHVYQVNFTLKAQKKDTGGGNALGNNLKTTTFTVLLNMNNLGTQIDSCYYGDGNGHLGGVATSNCNGTPPCVSGRPVCCMISPAPTYAWGCATSSFSPC